MAYISSLSDIAAYSAWESGIFNPELELTDKFKEEILGFAEDQLQYSAHIRKKSKLVKLDFLLEVRNIRLLLGFTALYQIPLETVFQKIIEKYSSQYSVNLPTSAPAEIKTLLYLFIMRESYPEFFEFYGNVYGQEAIEQLMEDSLGKEYSIVVVAAKWASESVLISLLDHLHVDIMIQELARCGDNGEVEALSAIARRGFYQAWGVVLSPESQMLRDMVLQACVHQQEGGKSVCSIAAIGSPEILSRLKLFVGTDTFNKLFYGMHRGRSQLQECAFHTNISSLELILDGNADYIIEHQLWHFLVSRLPGDNADPVAPVDNLSKLEYVYSLCSDDQKRIFSTAFFDDTKFGAAPINGLMLFDPIEVYCFAKENFINFNNNMRELLFNNGVWNIRLCYMTLFRGGDDGNEIFKNIYREFTSQQIAQMFYQVISNYGLSSLDKMWFENCMFVIDKSLSFLFFMFNDNQFLELGVALVLKLHDDTLSKHESFALASNRLKSLKQRNEDLKRIFLPLFENKNFDSGHILPDRKFIRALIYLTLFEYLPDGQRRLGFFTAPVFPVYDLLKIFSNPSISLEEMNDALQNFKERPFTHEQIRTKLDQLLVLLKGHVDIRGLRNFKMR